EGPGAAFSRCAVDAAHESGRRAGCYLAAGLGWAGAAQRALRTTPPAAAAAAAECGAAAPTAAEVDRRWHLSGLQLHDLELQLQFSVVVHVVAPCTCSLWAQRLPLLARASGSLAGAALACEELHAHLKPRPRSGAPPRTLAQFWRTLMECAWGCASHSRASRAAPRPDPAAPRSAAFINHGPCTGREDVYWRSRSPVPAESRGRGDASSRERGYLA